MTFFELISPEFIERVIGCCVSVLFSLVICAIANILFRFRFPPSEDSELKTIGDGQMKAIVPLSSYYQHCTSGNMQNGRGQQFASDPTGHAAIFYSGDFLDGEANGQGTLTVFTNRQNQEGLHVMQVHGRFFGGQLIDLQVARVCHI
jgi:hypothetical protein